MEMVLPDILGDLRQLSAIFSVAGLLIGLVLWLAGWWTHRFWVVLSLTVLGGIWGLNHAADLRAAPLFAAIGVGLATGLLALTVIRLGAFFAGGVAALVLVQAWSPSWDQPLVSFLAGGLAGWFLFRYWTMALTSLAGVLLMVHCGLALVDKIGKLDAVAWTETRATLLNIVCLVLTAGGFLVQIAAEWLRKRYAGAGGEQKKEKKDGKKAKSNPVVLADGVAAFRRAS